MEDDKTREQERLRGAMAVRVPRYYDPKMYPIRWDQVDDWLNGKMERFGHVVVNKGASVGPTVLDIDISYVFDRFCGPATPMRR